MPRMRAGVRAGGGREAGEALGARLGQEAEELERAALAAHGTHAARRAVAEERDADTRSMLARPR